MKPKKSVITRRPIVVGNWKMHRTASDTRDLLQDIGTRVSRIANMDLVACPPFTSLPAASDALGRHGNGSRRTVEYICVATTDKPCDDASGAAHLKEG